jgi:hypothetical protein
MKKSAMSIPKTLTVMLTKNKGANPPAPRAAPEFITFGIDVLSVKSSNNYEFLFLVLIFRILNLYL